MRASAIGEHIAVAMENRKDKESFGALLGAVRGGEVSIPQGAWEEWGQTLDQWVEAYPAFGAGRMLRARTAREVGALDAAERLAEAAVFSAEPGRLFDLLFRSGIEAEIASFARAVEALEPEVEDAMRLKWHPEQSEGVADDPDAGAEEPAAVVEAEEVEGAEPEVKAVEVPEEGSLAREVVLGAIERSIEQEIRELRGEMEPEPELEPQREPEAEPERSPEVNLAKLSPLARWAFERSRSTGFSEGHGGGEASGHLRVAAERIDEVMQAGAAADGGADVDGEGLDQQAALIDLFIRNEPTIGPIRPEVEHRGVKELAKESLVEDASLITETMARIYAAQGQIGRARRAYKLLALKYPEKSVYFAAQSKKLGRKSSNDG